MTTHAIRTGYPHPVAYTYMAAVHCPYCTEDAFGVDESGFPPESACDGEGNPIGAIAPWDTSDFPEGIYCDDCFAEIAEPAEVDA